MNDIRTTHDAYLYGVEDFNRWDVKPDEYDDNNDDMVMIYGTYHGCYKEICLDESAHAEAYLDGIHGRPERTIPEYVATANLDDDETEGEQP